MTSATPPDADRRTFRRTLARVLSVQLVTILLLALLQIAYTP